MKKTFFSALLAGLLLSTSYTCLVAQDRGGGASISPATNTTMGKVKPGTGCSITTPGIIDCTGTPTCSTTITNQGNSDAALPANQLYTAINTALTAPRTLTLPAASAAGSCPYSIYDKVGGVTSTNTETIARAGADTINGGVSWALTGAYQSAICQSDGISAWTCYAGNNLSPASGQFVTGINCTSGGCALVFGTITANIVPKANSGGTALADSTLTDDGLVAIFSKEFGISKITDPNTAPGAGVAKLTVEAGTNAGTCKVVIRAGTSATAVTIVDNVGGAC